MRVLVTRAEPDGRAFADQCRAAGLAPILSPVMRIEINRANLELEGVGALAVTSANGVRAFAANCDRRDLPVFAVGPVTAAAAAEAGFSTILTAGGDVASLADHIASERGLSGQGVLHVTGEDRAGDLIALLAARGVAARRQALYRASPITALAPPAITALERAGPLPVTLFSPRTASLFLDLVDKAGLTQRLAASTAVCLSDAVATAASAASWSQIIVADEKTANGVLKALTARADGA